MEFLEVQYFVKEELQPQLKLIENNIQAADNGMYSLVDEPRVRAQEGSRRSETEPRKKGQRISFQSKSYSIFLCFLTSERIFGWVHKATGVHDQRSGLKFPL